MRTIFNKLQNVAFPLNPGNVHSDTIKHLQKKEGVWWGRNLWQALDSTKGGEGGSAVSTRTRQIETTIFEVVEVFIESKHIGQRFAIW